MNTTLSEGGPLSELVLLVLIENYRLRAMLRKKTSRELETDASGTRRTRLRRVESATELALRTRIEMLRLARGLLHKDLAHAIGVTRSRVSSVLSGAVRVPPSWLDCLGRILSVNPAELVEGLDWHPERNGRPRPPRRRRPRTKRNPSEDERTLALRIRRLLSAQGKRHKDLAEHIGVSRVAVTLVLGTSVPLPSAWVPRLSHFLGITPSELLEGLKHKPHRR